MKTATTFFSQGKSVEVFFYCQVKIMLLFIDNISDLLFSEVTVKYVL